MPASLAGIVKSYSLLGTGFPKSVMFVLKTLESQAFISVRGASPWFIFFSMRNAQHSHETMCHRIYLIRVHANYKFLHNSTPSSSSSPHHLILDFLQLLLALLQNVFPFLLDRLRALLRLQLECFFSTAVAVVDC